MPGAPFKLNQAQQQVVNHPNGPLLVVAGAGTGKTRVIVEKINGLLDQSVKPSQILALTFTEKAAAEMLDRIMSSRDQLMLEMPIMTFNAYGGSLLKEFNVDAGLARNHVLLGENAKVVFLRQHLTELELDYFSPLSNPEGLLPDVASFFSKLKQHVIAPEQYDAFIATLPAAEESEQLEKTKHQELVRAYANYLKLSTASNVIDFDDQIYRVIELLEQRPNIREQLRDRYHTILVDEFQDTNPMQSRLIDLLVNQQQNIVVVGDDDQSIYGFRGATLANILDFKKRYPKAKEISLVENYRSAQAILDASYQLIKNNNPFRLEAELGINKQLHAQTAGQPPLIREFATIQAESHWIADDIQRRLKSGQLAGSIAVLCRRNAVLAQLHEALELAGVEHVVIGERYRLYKTTIVRAVLEVLRAVADPRASTSLYYALSGPVFTASSSDLAELASQARYNKQELEAYLHEHKPGDLAAALDFITKWRAEASQLSVGRLLFKIIDESGLKDKLYTQALEDPVASLSVTQLSQFFQTLKEFESVASMPTLQHYLDSFPLLEAAGETDEDGTMSVSQDQVNLLTIHKSKGLEWQTVYIPDCTEGSFPLRARGGGIPLPESLVEATSSAADDHLAEERRLLYVAITRAKTDAILSYALKHHTPTAKKPSRFLAEAFGDYQPIRLTRGQQVAHDSQLLLDPTVTAPKPLGLPRNLLQGSSLRLSVSQIVCFLDCPLNFYYKHILNVPEPPSSTASYGSAIHAAIEHLNQALSRGEAVTVPELQAIIDEKWSNAGYLSAEHAGKAKIQAHATIANFYQVHQAQPAPSRLEWPFAAHLNEPDIIIRGRLDAVFESDSEVEIRDYKTSNSVTSEAKAKQRATASDQLTLYALVWQQLTGELPNKLSLEFVDTNIIGSVKKTQRGIDGMMGKLAELTELIRANQYPARGEHRFCQHPSPS